MAGGKADGKPVAGDSQLEFSPFRGCVPIPQKVAGKAPFSLLVYRPPLLGRTGGQADGLCQHRNQCPVRQGSPLPVRDGEKIRLNLADPAMPSR